MTRLRLFAIALFSVILVGCKNDDPTYTVWTETVPYSEYSAFFGSLQDGYYVRKELTNAEFKEIKPYLENEYRRAWDEDQLYNYFIGRGFDSATADEQKAWLVTIQHGFIASRTGSVVYVLTK